MQHITNISIDTPCHASWNQMTRVEQGRHCGQCKKAVTDFTLMTNNEIIKYLSANESVCGRFDLMQLAGLNSDLAPKEKNYFSWKGLVAAASLISMVSSLKAEAKQVPATEQTESFKKHQADTIPADSSQYVIFKGTVLSRNDGLPIAGAQIKISGTSIIEQTNANGNFFLRVPVSASTAQVSFIGFNMVEVNVRSSSSKRTIMLYESQATLGLVATVIKPAPLHKRILYKVKHIF